MADGAEICGAKAEGGESGGCRGRWREGGEEQEERMKDDARGDDLCDFGQD